MHAHHNTTCATGCVCSSRMPVVLLLRLRDREMQRQIGWIRGNSSKKTKTQETVWMTAAGSRKRKWRRKNAPELQAKTAPQFFFFFERCRLWLRPNYEEIPAELTFRAFSRPKWRGCSPFFHVLQHPTLQIRLRAFPVWPGGGNGRRKPAQKRGATWPRPAPLGG